MTGPRVPEGAPRVYPARPRDVPPSTRDLRAELNEAQYAAASHGTGPLLIIAGAGTGKTRTLVYRVAHLIDTGVPPERILLLTFTRRAAQEMLMRAERLVGSASGRVHGGTFHSVGHRILRQYGAAGGLPSDFTIMDQADAEDLMQLSRAHLGYAQKSRRFPKKETLHWVYSRHLNTEEPIEEILYRDLPRFAENAEDFTRIFADFAARKSDRNLVDYDDLLLFWALLLEQAEAVSGRIAGQYDHILVDEYQDTNILQARILKGMCRSHQNLSVVGDDAQGIYSFRGANFRNIIQFPAAYPGTRLVTLEQNYRSTQPILDVTNTLISRAEERFTKNLWTAREGGEKPWLVTARDESQQTRFVVDRVLELHEAGTPLREMAVLFRAGYMSADLEIELTNRKVPFEKWGGLKFLEAAHVKDVLAFLRVADNPRDEVSWYRICLLMPGIGDVTARALIASMAERAWDPDAFTHFVAPPRARDAHQALSVLLRTLRRGGNDAVALAGEIGAIRGLYDDILRQRYDRPEARLADLDQLRTIAAGYPGRSAFLAALALDPPSSTQDLATGASDADDDALILSTAHSAKGKEWDAVFVIWAVDGWFPLARAAGSDDELEEERRLMYVAMTRARNHLAVSYPLNTYSSRRSMDYSMDQVSRFLDRGVRELMERVILGNDDDADSPPPPPAQLPPIDLRALVRRRFEGGG
ncbi:MAG TPA: ATP-dependent helicase [Gemmatimonadaceae bacterium]|jgi:DNA helicase-2/ATP-dependent DNA helicase PcrA|nr:ATP-dependent helicase [Gemmatimonadaceae bacterium]